MDDRDTLIAAVTIPNSEVNMIEIEKVCVDFTAGRGTPRAVDDVSLHIAARARILALSVPAAREKHSAAYLNA
ncbi:hypothetical protein KCP74_24030 [Salmonella enterica subsp. enterica]|nr:hypothetical protein KCP74_24030 [Salmonella enterica subsp. enterica]